MKKKYKAIYDSRTNLFKGHKLLIDVSELALIFYFINSSEEKYCDYLKVILPNANWLNFNSSDDYEYWEAHQINMALNQSKVGLCLSEEEGAMFASIQYLLAGLPVVTTMNVGGRDEFFDTDFVNWVADKPTAVKNGVDQLIAKDVDPNHIREKTLEKMLVHRNRFIELIQKIYDSHDIEMNFSEEWENVFFDKMVDWNMSWRVVLKVVRQ